MLHDQYGYPLHPAYSFSPWDELSTLSKLIFYGLAAETFGFALFVTCSLSSALAERVRNRREKPSSTLNRQFRNHGLGHIPRVGILEFGRKKNGYHLHRHRSKGEDRLHAHMVIDGSCWAGSIEGLLDEIERCFRYGRGDTPAHGGRVIYAECVTFQTPCRPSSIYRLPENGAIGCLVYGALHARRTMRYLGRLKPKHRRWEARFQSFRPVIASPRLSSTLRFGDLVFHDAGTGQLARDLHGSPSTPGRIVQRVNDIQEQMYGLHSLTIEDFAPDDSTFVAPIWQRRQDESWKAQYGL